MKNEKWTFEGGEWITSSSGERIAQVYNWHAGYLERGQLIASAPNLKVELAKMVRWATHGNKQGNPYGKDEVMSALRLLAKLGGTTDPYNVDTASIIKGE